MRDIVEARFGEALALVSLAELTRGTMRSRSAWEKYASGDRRITDDAAQELAAYLRARSESLSQAAEALERAVADQENTHWVGTRGDGRTASGRGPIP